MRPEVHALAGLVEDGTEPLHRERRLALVGQMRQRQVAARRHRVHVARHQAPRIGGVGNEHQDGRHQHPDRLAEVDELAKLGVAEDRVRLAQVTADHNGRSRSGEQGTALRFHHRVVVDVDHPGVRGDPLNDIVRVPHGRQPGTDVNELPDTVLGDPLGRPLVKPAVGPGAVLNLRYDAQYLLGGTRVDVQVMLAAQHVVINPSWRGDIGIHPGGDLRLSHRRLH